MKRITLTDVKGLLVGHSESKRYRTGCTAILSPLGAVASAYNPGFAPGSCETDLLKPENGVEVIHGLVFSGGSAFGISAASGVMRFLRENEIGLDVGDLRVPLVPAAVIYDYPANKSKGSLPDQSLGFEAAQSADTKAVLSGPFGAGVSACSGKVGGAQLCSPSGIGSYGVAEHEVQVAALAVVNPLGSVIEPETGEVISGLKRPQGGLAGRQEILEAVKGLGKASFAGNTVLIAVATNVRLTKLDAYRLARMASAGVPRAVYPAQTMFDGDTIFALSTNSGPSAPLSYLGALAAEVVSRAIVESVPKTKRNLK
jgi:L-aminopeptidase/D-esterase-like protein